jgi:tRNA dimethylallyltransferase
LARVQGAERDRRPALVVAGPTCSGKSALALALAERLGGTIVNADSMQVYRELRVLTARPAPEEEARVPHALYGVRSAAEAGSVAWWRSAALDAMAAARMAGRVPILCGGTGLYLASLAGGLAATPDPGEAARTEARALLREIGPAALHARLAERDPDTAARLRPSDSQRIARAWEVWRGTGRGLAAWQAAHTADEPGWTFSAVLLDPPRPALRAAIAARFGAMMEQGALGEVRALRALGLPPALPAMRAHGVPELSAFLDGTISLEEAAARAVAATRRYTKRQATWFRHHSLGTNGHQRTIHARWNGTTQFSEKDMADLCSFVRGLG